jgi:glycosyltransferase involved in cell wall biosynthesis
MQLIHLTVKRFKHISADNVYISKLINCFHNILNDEYFLVAAARLDGPGFQDINVINLHLPLIRFSDRLYFWFPYLYFFGWFPLFVFFSKFKFNDSLIFFASDPNLLTIAIWWKKVLRLSYRVNADLHMLNNDWRDNFIVDNADHIITTSQKLKQQVMSRQKSSADKTLVAYGGVDEILFNEHIDRIEARRQLGLPINNKIVAYVGLFKTMKMEKGITTMIESLPYLDNSGVVMIFVGGKDEEIREYSAQAQKLGQSERVIFFPIVAPEKLPLFELAADVLVIPYPDEPHFKNYGFPMKVYEYMATSRPIIYSRLEIISEMLGDCGFSFKSSDAKELAEQIKFVLADDNNEIITAKINLARQKVQNFSWHQKADRIINYIRS